MPHLSITISALGLALCKAMVYPVGLTNCGESNWIASPPKRAVTMNQGATEVLLAMNLSDSMVGTAYLDDAIWPELAESYAKIPVLSDTYPDIETLMSVQPDFIFGSYSSAFRQGDSLNYSSILGDCGLDITNGLEGTENQTDAFCRKELHDFAIQTYLQSPQAWKVCLPKFGTFANIFDAHEQARVLIDHVEDHLQQANDVAEFGKTLNAAPIRVLWLDSWDDEAPFVGACCGSVNLILQQAGAVNIFDNLGAEELKSWDNAPWKEIAELDPDLIVVVDASWDQADEKLMKLCSHPIARELRAVQNRALITVPFSASTLGVRVGSLSYNLAEAFVAIVRAIPLSNVDFTEVMITADQDIERQGVAKSGARVYTRLPVFHNTDLDSFCPGTSNVRIGTSPRVKVTEMRSSSSDSIPSWSIALIAVSGVGVLVAIASVSLLVMREKKGNPYFTPTHNDKST